MANRAETVDSEQEALILDGIERFLDRDVRPHVAALEHDDIYPEDIVEKMKEMGSSAPPFPKNMAVSACRSPPTPRSSSGSPTPGCR